MKTNTASTTPPTPPEPQGSTVQEKLASARSIIADLFNRVLGLIARSGRGGAGQKRIEPLFAKLNKEVRATQAKASHLAGEVASARAAYDIEHNRAERAARNEGLLQSFCEVKGLDWKTRRLLRPRRSPRCGRPLRAASAALERRSPRQGQTWNGPWLLQDEQG